MLRQPPPGMNDKSIPTIGEKKIADYVTFELGPFKFHPPVGFDHAYVMMMVMMASGSANMYKVVHAFQPPGSGLAQVYLAEDCELGKKHELAMVTADAEGRLGFMVARPVEDDPDKDGDPDNGDPDNGDRHSIQF